MAGAEGARKVALARGAGTGNSWRPGRGRDPAGRAGAAPGRSPGNGWTSVSGLQPGPGPLGNQSCSPSWGTAGARLGRPSGGREWEATRRVKAAADTRRRWGERAP